MRKFSAILTLLVFVVLAACASSPKKELKLPTYQNGDPSRYANMCMDAIDEYLEDEFDVDQLPGDLEDYVRENYEKRMAGLRTEYAEVFNNLHKKGKIGNFPNYLERYRSTGRQCYLDYFIPLAKDN